MKSTWLRKALPHVIAIAIFIIVAAIFCKPALQSGMTLQQSDVAGWKGMAQSSFDYKEKHGHMPLWITSMFSGMPAYQITFEGPWTPVEVIGNIFTLWLPKPLNFFFLACICFYIFCMCMRIRPWVAIIGSLAFAYCSFDPIMIGAGHETQMLTLAYCPAVLGGMILVYEKKYLSGFALTALFTMMNIGMNHQQISYYLFLVAGIMTVSYIIQWIKAKDYTHLLKSLGLVLVAGTLGVLVSAVNIFITSDYVKYSKRGGQLILDNKKDGSKETTSAGKTKGLTKEYAFQWSYGKTETLTLLFPGVMGYGAQGAELGENSHVAKYLEEKANQPAEQATQIAQSLSGAVYWGEQPFTSGPVYLGAVVCFLFIFGLIYVKSHHKWWILIASVLAIFMAWGKYFPGFNYLLFDYLPLYNKFRVPTMTLVIPQLLFPILGVLAINKLLNKEDSEAERWKSLKISAIAAAAVFLVAGLMYVSLDFKRENRARTNAFNQIVNSKSPDMSAQIASLNEKFIPESDNGLYENFFMQTQGNAEISRGLVNSLQKDRASVFGKDIVRSFALVAVTIVLLGLFIRSKINETILLAGIGLFMLIDLIPVGKKFLNENHFVEADTYETQTWPKTPVDEMILADKEPNFRVYNLAGGDPFQESHTSYYHNSIGGYSPAKIGIYDDLITYQLSGNPNQQVLDMLNTKYILQKDQSGKTTAFTNENRLGNCWIVKGVHFVKGPAEEMTALNSFNAKDTAIVDESFKAQFPSGISYDSAASIKLVKFDNDIVQYESNAGSPQVALFSEIYYPGGWNAYLDGKKVDYFKADYVLRGMVVPAGKHAIEFKFEPRSYYWGAMFSKYFSYIILLVLALAAFMEFRKHKPSPVATGNK